MSDLSNVVRLTQGLGITASAMASGSILGFSFASVPTLILPAGAGTRTRDSTAQTPGTSSSHIATQFRHLYSIGVSTMPPLGLTAGSAYSYLAYTFSSSSASGDATRSKVYLLAAALALGIIPYTLLVMNTTNKKLFAIAEKADAQASTQGASKEKESKVESNHTEVLGLLKTWTCMNTVRGLFPLAAAAVGLVATLGFTE